MVRLLRSLMRGGSLSVKPCSLQILVFDESIEKFFVVHVHKQFETTFLSGFGTGGEAHINVTFLIKKKNMLI